MILNFIPNPSIFHSSCHFNFTCEFILEFLKIMKIAVIGSGLSALSAVNVLVKSGHTPYVFDVGNKPSENTLFLKKKINDLIKNNHNNTRNFLDLSSNTRGEFPRKFFYGSDYVYNYYDYNLTCFGAEGNYISRNYFKFILFYSL